MKRFILLPFLCHLMLQFGNSQTQIPGFQYSHGAIIRADTATPKLALVFTGHEYGEGSEHILKTLNNLQVKASFFFTGTFYANPSYKTLIQKLKKSGHYLGAHSDRHLLYCDWEQRDSLLVTQSTFIQDLRSNYQKMKGFGIKKSNAPYFLPPYEWHNDSIAVWTHKEGLQLINITHGTKTHTDYMNTNDPNYISSKDIYRSVWEYEEDHVSGLNGFILLLHIGAGPNRKDKFYLFLESLIIELQKRGYMLCSIDQLLKY